MQSRRRALRNSERRRVPSAVAAARATALLGTRLRSAAAQIDDDDDAAPIEVECAPARVRRLLARGPGEDTVNAPDADAPGTLAADARHGAWPTSPSPRSRRRSVGLSSCWSTTPAELGLAPRSTGPAEAAAFAMFYGPAVTSFSGVAAMSSPRSGDRGRVNVVDLGWEQHWRHGVGCTSSGNAGDPRRGPPSLGPCAGPDGRGARSLELRGRLRWSRTCAAGAGRARPLPSSRHLPWTWPARSAGMWRASRRSHQSRCSLLPSSNRSRAGPRRGGASGWTRYWPRRQPRRVAPARALPDLVVPF